MEKIHLNSRKLEHCRACGDGWGACRSKGVCVIQDDFAEIYGKLREADGIVWVSAVYWWDMTECFKAFFDRLRRCEGFTNRFLEGKRCLLVACAGGTGKGVTECLMHTAMGKTLVLNLGYSHPINLDEADGVTFDVPDPNTIIVKCADKQKCGQIASEIRGKRPPEPYHGQGVKYDGEVIRRKAGKAGK